MTTRDQEKGENLATTKQQEENVGKSKKFHDEV